MRTPFLFAMLVLLSLASRPAYALDLTLRCDGIGTFVQSQSASVTTYGPGGPRYGDATTFSQGSVADEMMVKVNEDAVSVHVPNSIVPLLHSGGPEGWWTLYDVQVTDAEISGRFRINFLNKPTVRIDRASGRIDVQGLGGGFQGKCTPYVAGEKAF